MKRAAMFVWIVDACVFEREANLDAFLLRKRRGENDCVVNL